MFKLEEIIPGEISLVGRPNELTREETLAFFHDKEIVNIQVSESDGTRCKAITLVDDRILARYRDFAQSGKVNGRDVDLRLVEVVDYFENVLHMKIDSCTSGQTMNRHLFEYRGMDRYGNHVQIYWLVPISGNECCGHICFKHTTSKLIINKMKELLESYKGTTKCPVDFKVYDTPRIEWTTVNSKEAIDEACAYLTKVVIENL